MALTFPSSFSSTSAPQQQSFWGAVKEKAVLAIPLSLVALSLGFWMYRDNANQNSSLPEGDLDTAATLKLAADFNQKNQQWTELSDRIEKHGSDGFFNKPKLISEYRKLDQLRCDMSDLTKTIANRVFKLAAFSCENIGEVFNKIPKMDEMLKVRDGIIRHQFCGNSQASQQERCHSGD